MDSPARPISASERIVTIDIVRGFALLGIFIMNVPWFNTSFFAEAVGVASSGRIGGTVTAETVRDVLFSGKFNSMFSMLFAVGFTIQLERLEARAPEHATSDLSAAIVLAVRVRRRACVRILGRRCSAHVRACSGCSARVCGRLPDKVIAAAHRPVPALSSHPGHGARAGSDAGRRVKPFIAS